MPASAFICSAFGTTCTKEIAISTPAAKLAKRPAWTRTHPSDCLTATIPAAVIAAANMLAPKAIHRPCANPHHPALVTRPRIEQRPRRWMAIASDWSVAMVVDPAALRDAAEQLDDIFVRGLPEVSVVRADRVERLGRGQTDNLVAVAPRRPARRPAGEPGPAERGP